MRFGRYTVPIYSGITVKIVFPLLMTVSWCMGKMIFKMTVGEMKSCI